MKRKLLPLLAAGLSASSVVGAADNIPTIYGKVNVTLNNYSFDRIKNATTSYTAQDNWQLESNASRIGVKGDYPVAGDTKIIYKLEYELFADGSPSSQTGASKYNTFTQRNTYAGLQGGWGTLFAGKNDTPLKAIAAETVQLFKDLPLTDYKYFLVGEDRESNIIQYTTPNFSGFAFSAQIEPGEDSGGDNAPTHDNSGLIDRYSLAATYKQKNVYAALANAHNVNNANIVRAVGQVGVGPVTLGALWQKADRNYKDSFDKTNQTTKSLYLPSVGSLPVSQSGASNGNLVSDFTGGSIKSQDGYALSAGWKIDGSWTVKGQYGRSTTEADGDHSSPLGLGDTKLTSYALGVDYKLNDNAKVFAYYAELKADGDNRKYDGMLKDKTFAVGYDFKF